MPSRPLTVPLLPVVPNILLVDDNADNLHALEAILRCPGQNLVLAQSGDEALKYLLEREFALILVDGQMPGMDSFETISRIRRQEQTRDIPVILLTAIDRSAGALFREDLRGVTDFLFKPIVPEALRSKVAVFVELFRTTEQLKMQTELLHQYELFLNSVGKGFYGLDHLGQIIFVNPAGAQLLGLSVNALVNRSLHEIAHIKTAEAPPHPSEQCPIHLTLADGVSRRVENEELRREDGSVSAVDYMVGPILRESRIVGAVVVVHEVTEERDLREQLRRSQELDANGQLAGIAHDFNNLLAIILGWSQLAKQKLNPESPLYHDLTLLDNAGEQAAVVTRQLLAFSRKQLIETRAVDLNAMVKDLDKLIGSLIGEGIEIVTVLSPVLGRIKIDPSQIEQVILNLVANARDAMPQGGKLTIVTSNAKLEEQHDFQRMGADPGLYVVLTVSDTGVGTDSEPEARIFKPFFTTTEPEEAIGLGLSTIYGIVTQSGGHIAVHSESDQGTTFKIYLPGHHDQNPIMSPDLERETARESKTIARPKFRS